MPIRTNSTPQKVCFAIGIALLLYYWDWIMQQQDSNVQTKNGVAAHDNFAIATLATTFLGQLVMLFAAANNKPLLPEVKNVAPQNAELEKLKQRLAELVVVKAENIPTYKAYQQQRDINHIIKALLEIYQENLTDKCKIICLLNQDKFEFEINLVSAETIKKLLGGEAGYSADALYQENSEKILVRHKIYQENLTILKQELSHELRHAMDAYDNKQHGRWPVVYNGKNRNRIFMWGTPKEQLPNNGFPQYELNDLTTVRNIIEKEFDNLTTLHKALDKPSTRTAQEKITIGELTALIKKYHYEFTVTNAKIPAIVNTLAESNAYIYDSVRERYHPNNNTLYFDYQNELYFLLEYTLNPDTPIVVALTDASIDSDERRLKDLFLNLESRFNNIKQALKIGIYTIMMLPSEYAAIIDEVLAPFSHTLPDSKKTLRDILFPGLVKLEAARRSEEHQHCLVRRR